MAEAFVRTFKRDYVRVSARPDARSVIDPLPIWIDHYNRAHPHSALGYRSPREFIDRSTREARQAFRGRQQSDLTGRLAPQRLPLISATAPAKSGRLVQTPYSAPWQQG